MSFYVKTKEPEFTRLMSKFLKEEGYVQKHSLPIDFVFFSGEMANYSNKIDGSNINWLSILYGKSVLKLCNKETLHKEYSKSSFLIPTKIIKTASQLSSIKFDNPKILKPAKGWKGSGIAIVTSKEEAEDWLHKHSKYDSWLIQDYIMNPALKNGYKFHLRVLVLVKKPHGAKREVYVATHKFYVKATKKYKESDWEDPDIHDTHFKPMKIETFPQTIPDDWTKESTLAADTRIDNIIKDLLKHETDFIPDWNAKNGFEVFGADIIFKGHTPYLLEFNNKMSLKGRSSYAPGIASTVLFDKYEPYFRRIL